jgi:hypothetical protein
MDPTVRLDHFRDGLKSASERQSKWESLTEEQKGFHREQMKFLIRQFVIIEKEMAEFFACGK